MYNEYKEANKEKFRLLYVALTRPRESLTIMIKAGSKTEIKDIYSFDSFYDLINYSTTFSDDAYYFDGNLAKKTSIKDEQLVVTKNKEYKTLHLKDKVLIKKSHASHEVFEVSEEVNRILDRGTLLHSFFEVTNFLNEIENTNLG